MEPEYTSFKVLTLILVKFPGKQETLSKNLAQNPCEIGVCSVFLTAIVIVNFIGRKLKIARQRIIKAVPCLSETRS